MSAKKLNANLSPRPLVGVAKRQLDWKPNIFGKCLSLTVKFCNNFLAFDAAKNTLKMYFYIVFLGSLLAHYAEMPRGYYLVGKRNVFNDYFVKWSWAWTLAFLTPFMLISSFVYSARQFRNVFRQLVRLAVATALWFVCIQVFTKIEKSSAFCSLANTGDGDGELNEADCTKKKGRWRSYEVSGHVFILTYIALVTTEELSIFRIWQRLGQKLQKSTNYLSEDSSDENINKKIDNADESLRQREGFSKSPSKSPKSVSFSPSSLITAFSPSLSRKLKIDEDKQKINVLYRRYGFLVGYFYVLNVSISVLWTFMILITCVYYHSFEHKAVAYIVAVLCWYLTYKVWYPRFYPGSPGYGRIKL